jgi:hypothetical protein
LSFVYTLLTFSCIKTFLCDKRVTFSLL